MTKIDALTELAQGAIATDDDFPVVDNSDPTMDASGTTKRITWSSLRTDIANYLASLAQTLTNKTISGSNNTITNVSLTSSVTGTLPLANGGTNATTAAAARTQLGVDAAGTDNSTDVTLAGTPDYITISGQIITRNQVDLANDVTGNLPVTNLNSGTGATSSTFWRGDGSWSTPAGSGDVSKVGTPVDNQVGVWTGDGTIEGDAALTFDTSDDTLSIGASGKLAFGAVDVLSDSSGTTTLQNIDAIDATTETTLEGALELDSLQGNLGVSHLNSGTGASASTFWRGDATWATPAGGGNVSNTGTPADDQVAVWTSSTVIEGTSGLTKSATQFTAGNYTFNTDQTVGASQDNFVLTYDDASGEIGLEAASGGGSSNWDDVGSDGVELVNGTTSQFARIHNTFTDASNYERAGFYWSSNIFYIDTERAGTGGSKEIRIAIGGTVAWRITSTGQLWAGADNTYDIGGNNTFVRPRDIYIIGALHTQDAGELTISSGAISVTGGFHTVDTESDAATDDLDTINGGIDGQHLIIRAENSARTVVAKDGTGNLQLAGDFSMDNAQDTLQLIFDNTLSAWLEISRSNNGT